MYDVHYHQVIVAKCAISSPFTSTDTIQVFENTLINICIKNE